MPDDLYDDPEMRWSEFLAAAAALLTDPDAIAAHADELTEIAGRLSVEARGAPL